jgi:hypothetical protein
LFYRIEPTETQDLFGVMDGYDADLGHIAEMIIDPATGEIDDALRDRLAGFEPDVLVLCRAELDAKWRGFGLGAVLAGQAIKQLGHGCLAVVLQPASVLSETERERRPGNAPRKRSRRPGRGSGSHAPATISWCSTWLQQRSAKPLLAKAPSSSCRCR